MVMMMVVMVSGLGFGRETERNERQNAQTDQKLLHQYHSLKNGRNFRASYIKTRARLVSVLRHLGLARGNPAPDAIPPRQI